MLNLKKESPRHKGFLIETEALQFLEQQGLHFIERNFNCKLGEIDLICQDKEFLVFVEVRFRRSNLFGGAAASIDSKKCLKIRRTATYYLKIKGKMNTPCRIDIVAATLKNNLTEFEWIKNAI